jgi:hypothetical protein
LTKKYKYINPKAKKQETDAEVKQRLLNDLWNGGVEVTVSEEVKASKDMGKLIDDMRDEIVDKVLPVSAWVSEYEGKKFQICKIVKEVKEEKKKDEVSEEVTDLSF